MNCIVIDDEGTSRFILSKLIAGIENLDLIECYEHPMDAIKFLNKEKVDLIFLDIHMPGFSGFDFIDTLKAPPKVILTTSDDSLAIDAFGYNCVVDYLLKPITAERFAKAVEKAQAALIPSISTDEEKHAPSESSLINESFFVNIDRTLIKIHTSEVYLIEAKGDYILIKTTGKEYRVHSTLKKMVKKLPANQFIQVHRSFVINLSKIIDIQDNTILIEKNVIPISRSKRPEFLRRLDLL